MPKTAPDRSRRPRIVVAPDKFKGGASAVEVTAALARGWSRVAGERHAVERIPMADGGEGTVDAFVDAGAIRDYRLVAGPRGDPVRAAFARDGDLAIVEMAAASGLALLEPARYDARAASTYGTGETIAAALDAGARRIVVGIGGSATNDGGAGMLVALGARLRDAAGRDLPRGGAALRDLATIDLAGLDPRLRDVALEVAADVDNPLCGPRGASVTFGAQKGASAAAIVELDAALGHFADIAARTLGRDERDRPGAGAAGGIGFALAAFLGARMRPGVEIVAELRGLPTALDGAALCLTGEGRIDAQTLHGKTVAGVAKIARRCGVPVVAFAGTLEGDAEAALHAQGVTCVPILERPLDLADALAGTRPALERAAARLARTILATRGLGAVAD